MPEENLQSDIPDRDIIALILQDKHNFSLVVERYTQKLSRYIARITNISPQDREDLLQNIFIKIYININSFERYPFLKTTILN